MSEHKNGLAELAALAANVPPERRRQIERDLPFIGNPKHDKGVAAGLAQAAEVMARQSAEAAVPLREMAAVAAAEAIKVQQAFDEAGKLLTPQARAEMDEEIRRIESGEAKRIPFEDVLREMEEMQRRWEQEGRREQPPAES